jgi:hypothetical protein
MYTGNRFNTLIALAQKLHEDGAPFVAIEIEVLERNKSLTPPLSVREVMVGVLRPFNDSLKKED